MTDLLNIGAQGLAAYRGALSVTGENVVNAGTAGYQRRGSRAISMPGSFAALIAFATSGVT